VPHNTLTGFVLPGAHTSCGGIGLAVLHKLIILSLFQACTPGTWDSGRRPAGRRSAPSFVQIGDLVRDHHLMRQDRDEVYAVHNYTDKEPAVVKAAPAVTSDDGPSMREPRNFFDRLEHFTWAWFTLPMATGGLALLLNGGTQPHSFDGLNTIGKVVYIFDLVVFVTLCSCMTYRFVRWPKTFLESITHPTESLFLGPLFLSTATIISCMGRYGEPNTGPWLIWVLRILFWLYVALTFILAVSQYALLFTSPKLKLIDMTPAWDLPIFPFMLSGTIASVTGGMQPPEHAVPILVAGITAQGLGFTVATLMSVLYVRRMIEFGLPPPAARPAMFIAVGPPSFTALALFGMAMNFPRNYINYFSYYLHFDMNGPGGAFSDEQQQLIGVQITVTLAIWVAVFIWSMGVWFFCIALIATLMAARELKFRLNWWAFVFPNTGLTIATITLGKAFRSEGLKWVGSIMSIMIVATWLFIFSMHVHAVITRRILWPGKDEDVYVQHEDYKALRLQKMRRRQSRRLSHTMDLSADPEWHASH